MGASSNSWVAENWKYGWLGQFMWAVFSDSDCLNLNNEKIAVMTTLNFTGATDPANVTSVYKGTSSFTRCVWEVYLGNIVSPALFTHFWANIELL
jgi:hypothetical protein